MKTKAVVSIFLVVPSLFALEPAQLVALATPDTEFKAARQAKQDGDIETALLHYENLLDAARSRTKTTTRAMLYARLGELKRKLHPNTDPAKAGEWKVKAYAFRTTDVRWKDDKGTNLFLVKLTRFTGDWSFNLKLTDMGGNSLRGVEFRLP